MERNGAAFFAKVRIPHVDSPQRQRISSHSSPLNTYIFIKESVDYYAEGGINSLVKFHAKRQLVQWKKQTVADVKTHMGCGSRRPECATDTWKPRKFARCDFNTYIIFDSY